MKLVHKIYLVIHVNQQIHFIITKYALLNATNKGTMQRAILNVIVVILLVKHAMVHFRIIVYLVDFKIIILWKIQTNVFCAKILTFLMMLITVVIYVKTF